MYIYIYLYRCNHPLFFFLFFLHKPMYMQYKMCQATLAITTHPKPHKGMTSSWVCST